jgi:hypothetical protein
VLDNHCFTATNFEERTIPGIVLPTKFGCDLFKDVFLATEVSIVEAVVEHMILVLRPHCPHKHSCSTAAPARNARRTFTRERIDLDIMAA